LKAALAAWGTQSNANFRFAYGGRVNDTSTGFDYRNVTIFRNGTNGGMLASTYSWWAGATLATAKLVDADVIFWDGQMQFFGAYDYCTGGGGYIQDIATHEYGHALGLGHSGDTAATMYGSYNACDSSLRTLSPDDIAGIEYLYPPTTRVSNTAPTVSISSPGNSSSFVAGSPINFSGAANDSQDGNLSAGMTWSSSISGYIWSGGSFQGTLPTGTHVITASVTDSGGMSSSAQVTVTVTAEVTIAPPPPPPPSSSDPTLSARAYKVKGTRRADLSWSNLTAATVNITRDGSTVYSGTNNGVYMDLVGGKGAGTFTYKVCDSTNSLCTNPASAKF
jgi:hypothetical protein